jgi:hypothetical protein
VHLCAPSVTFCTRQTVTYALQRDKARKESKQLPCMPMPCLQRDEHAPHQSLSLWACAAACRCSPFHYPCMTWLEFEWRRPVARRDAGPFLLPPTVSSAAYLSIWCMQHAATRARLLGSRAGRCFCSWRLAGVVLAGDVVRARAEAAVK